MTDDVPDYPHGSPAARSVFAFIHHHGGTMRIAPLLRRVGMEQAILVDAINELVERRWLRIVWRKSARAAAAEGQSLRLADAERLVTTRWGRHRHGSSWPSY